MILIYKAVRKTAGRLKHIVDVIRTRVLFACNGVKYGQYKTTGVPYVMVARGGRCTIGDNFHMNNGIEGNPIGCYSKCTFFVDRGAELKIGKDVGISQSAIICHRSITIGDYVKIGGGVKIYDTDFHSLDPSIRKSKEDLSHREEKPVEIGNNVFIGAYTIILKGVTVGENSIVGAGSVVTKSIPANQIWAGNPAKFIREL